MNFKTNFDSIAEKEEFLKTRIESLSLSSAIEVKLKRENIITIRGLLNKEDRELKKQIGLSGYDIELIIKKLHILELELKLDNTKRNLNKEINLKITEIYNDLETEIFENVYSKLEDNKDDIIDYFAKYLNLKKEEIISPSRKKEVVEARNIIVYILRKYGDLSFPQISKMLGGRDHSTAIHSFNKISKIIVDENFSELISKTKELKNNKLLVENILIPKFTNKAIEKGVDMNFEYIKPKIITDRDLDILRLFREGLSLEKISKENNITRERARQIVKCSIYKLAFNESLKTHEKIKDADDLYKEERDIIICRKNKFKPVKQVKVKKWGANRFDFCVICNKAEFSYFKNGICEKCGGCITGDKREEIISIHNNKCDTCGILRNQAKDLYGRDLYISKELEVSCRKCHSKSNGKILGDRNKNKWRMFYK